MESIWKQTVELPQRECLPGDKQVKNLVIGAGMAGILTAYLLQKQGQQVMVVEAKKTASGQTGNTTAKITCQHGLFYDKVMHKVSLRKAEQYIQANKDAIQMYEKIIYEEGIECHLEHMPAFLYTTKEHGEMELRREAEAAKELGIEARFVKGSRVTGLPFEVKAAVRFAGQMQFHPLEFLKPLAEQLVIYEDTKVLEVREHMVITNRGTIMADNIIFATHYPIMNVPGFYFVRQHQERSYVLALRKPEITFGQECGSRTQKPGADAGGLGDMEGYGEEKASWQQGMYYSVDENGLSLRSYEDMLLLGGGSHRTGKGIDIHEDACQNHGKGYAYLREMAKKYFPQYTEVAAWAAQDCMPHDEIPFIGRYSIFRPYWYVTTGFKKWGMTSSMISAMIICGKIIGEKKAYEDVFSPQRFYVQAAWKNLLIDIGESVKGLWKGFFSADEHKCPHMGCELEWNEEEQSWECPCHGSRFDRSGELLDNPAQKDL